MMDRLAKVAGHVTKGAFVGELSALGGMFERGLLSAAEFKAAKEQLLSPPAAAAAGTVAAAAATPSPRAPVEMTDHEKFLYDLQGFLHVPGFLSFAEVAALNGAFDANWGKRHWGVGGTQNEFTGMLEWPKPHCDPFRDLLAHPKALPYLNTQFGQGWRMDHSPFMITGTAGADGENPAKGGGIHGGTAAQPGQASYYHFANNTMRCGLVVFAFMLTDVEPGDGGLVVVPGSHKSNYRPPAGMFTQGNDFDSELVYPVHNPSVKAGDLVIFNEATLHGTLPWRNTQHETRRLLYRYCPEHVNFHGGTFSYEQPSWTSELTLAQQSALEPPYRYNRVVVQNDLSVTPPRQHDASFGQLFEKVATEQTGVAPVQSRWGTQVEDTKPPPGFPSEMLGHGGLPATGWGKVARNGNGLLVPTKDAKK